MRQSQAIRYKVALSHAHRTCRGSANVFAWQDFQVTLEIYWTPHGALPAKPGQTRKTACYHPPMDAFLTNESSCALLRMARYCGTPRIDRCMARAPHIDEGSNVQWWRQAIRELAPILGIDKNHPLCVQVPNSESRVTSPLVSSVVCSSLLPEDSYLTAELESPNHDLDHSFYAIESAAHSFASLARVLSSPLHAGGISFLQARALLLSYGYELCGTYARDPMRPLTNECHYLIDAAATPIDIQDWCRARKGRSAVGIRLARACAQDVKSGSASPAETIHSIVFTSPPEYGGLGMGIGNVLLNETLRLEPKERLLMHRLPLTPDLTFPLLGGRVLEHQGSYHGFPLQHQEDASRVQDYGALGRPVFMTSAADFSSPCAYDMFLRRFVNWVWKDMGPRIARPYQEILDDPCLTDARYQLIETLSDRQHDPWHWQR